MSFINARRKKFCRLVSAGQSGASAYRQAYKNQNSITCKTNAYRLMQQPNVMVYLTIIQGLPPQPAAATGAVSSRPTRVKKQAKQTEAAAPPTPMPKPAARQLNDPTGQGTILTKIVRGQCGFIKQRLVKGKIIEERWPFRPRQIIRCIRLLNKMDGCYAPRKRKRKKPHKVLIIKIIT